MCGFLYKQSICVLDSVSHLSCYHPIIYQPFLQVTLLLFSERLGESPATSNIITVKYTNRKDSCLCTINFVSAHNYGNIYGNVMYAFNLQCLKSEKSESRKPQYCSLTITVETNRDTKK